jgi:urea transporter
VDYEPPPPSLGTSVAAAAAIFGSSASLNLAWAISVAHHNLSSSYYSRLTAVLSIMVLLCIRERRDIR